MKNNGTNLCGVLIVCLILLLTNTSKATELRVELNEGENWVSTNLITIEDEMYEEDEDRGPDVVLMWAQLADDPNDLRSTHKIIIMKGLRGFYTPAHNFCGIPFWDVTKVYNVNMSEDAVAIWEGELIDADTDIPVGRGGQNLIPYFPDYELDAGAPDFHVLSPIIDNVLIANDDHGGFMLPEMGFSNMEPWRPGEGYHIAATGADTLNYPEEQDGEPFWPFVGDHWDNLYSARNNSHLLITTINNVQPNLGDQIALFNSEGDLVGLGNVQDDVCGITAWDDYGAVDSLKMLYWDESRQMEFEVDIRNFENGDEPHYVHGVLILEVSTGMSVSDPPEIPLSYTLSSPYPNPFNANATLNYTISIKSHVQLRVFDVSGREIASLVNGAQAVGQHTVAWDGGSAPSGVYLFLLEVNGNSSITRGVLLR